jgi:hypothetical protein
MQQPPFRVFNQFIKPYFGAGCFNNFLRHHHSYFTGLGFPKANDRPLAEVLYNTEGKPVIPRVSILILPDQNQDYSSGHIFKLSLSSLFFRGPLLHNSCPEVITYTDDAVMNYPL